MMWLWIFDSHLFTRKYILQRLSACITGFKRHDSLHLLEIHLNMLIHFMEATSFLSPQFYDYNVELFENIYVNIIIKNRLYLNQTTI